MSELEHNIGTNRVPLRTGASAVYTMDEKLRDQFVYTSRFGEVVELHRTSTTGLLMLPRAACPMAPVDKRVVGLSFGATSKVVPRSEAQAKVIGDASKWLSKGKSFVVEAPTGFGKTVVAADLICTVGRKTLVIVPKEDLFTQWRKDLLEFTDLKPSEIGSIRGPKYDVQGKKVVIGMLHSLAKMGKYPNSMCHEFGFIIWDEVHRLPADTFSHTASRFAAKLRLGLSATPERSDGKEITIQAHIGPVLVKTDFLTLKPVVGMYRSPWRVPRYSNGKYMKHVAGRTMHVEKTLADHDARNALLMKLIHQCWSKGRKTVIFSSLVQHLRLLEVTSHSLGIHPKETGLYISATPAKDREKIKARPLIFATWGMMAEGTSINWLDCCILATPRSNVKQAIGRILREYPDKPDPVILDVVDAHSPVFKRYADSRMRTYNELGATIKKY